MNVVGAMMEEEETGIFPWETETVKLVLRSQRPFVRLLQSGLYLDVGTGAVISLEEGPGEKVQ